MVVMTFHCIASVFVCSLDCPRAFSCLTLVTERYLWGMPCTQCAGSVKFWMSANTRTLLLALFDKFLVPYWFFVFWLPMHLGCGTV